MPLRIFCICCSHAYRKFQTCFFTDFASFHQFASILACDQRGLLKTIVFLKATSKILCILIRIYHMYVDHEKQWHIFPLNVRHLRDSLDLLDSPIRMRHCISGQSTITVEFCQKPHFFMSCKYRKIYVFHNFFWNFKFSCNYLFIRCLWSTE